MWQRLVCMSATPCLYFTAHCQAAMQHASLDVHLHIISQTIQVGLLSGATCLAQVTVHAARCVVYKHGNV